MAIVKAQRSWIAPTDMKKMRKMATRMSKMARPWACATAVWLILFAHAPAGVAQQAAVANPIASPLRISAGDLIEVNMFENPDLSGRFRVDEKGDINVPLI